MKVRAGFVSNSSSSSFCILGVVVNRDVRKKVIELANQNLAEDDNPWDEEEDCFSEIAEAAELTYYSDEQSDYGEIVGIGIEGQTPAEVVKSGAVLIEMLGDLKFKVLSGEYYS